MTTVANVVRSLWGDILDAPILVRWPVLAGLAFGLVGALAGLAFGLVSYPPTSWAAAAEVGIPSCVLGALLGGVASVAKLLVGRMRRPA